MYIFLFLKFIDFEFLIKPLQVNYYLYLIYLMAYTELSWIKVKGMLYFFIKKSIKIEKIAQNLVYAPIILLYISNNSIYN